MMLLCPRSSRMETTIAYILVDADQSFEMRGEFPLRRQPVSICGAGSSILTSWYLSSIFEQKFKQEIDKYSKRNSFPG